MASFLEEQPFKNRDDLKAEIKRCSVFASYCMVFCAIFALLGIIGDASNTTLGLESMSWFLLAITSALFGIYPQMHSLAAKHLLYMDETKKEQ
jgi:putative exporter of polyketide antibiotics